MSDFNEWERIPNVYILVLNWNGWKDTIECLKSIMGINYPSYKVVVCDNCSHDGSFEHLKNWAVKNSIPFTEATEDQVEDGTVDKMANLRLSLIRIKENRGFAGGNNVGLRYIRANGDYQYVWLLNNDTTINPQSLYHMVSRMQEKQGAGLCGSTLYYYDKPNVIQAMGGASYNKWLGYSRHIGASKRKSGCLPIEAVEAKMDYVTGASMLVSKAFLDDVGLLCEDYFLYFEELDWAVRGKKKGYLLTYAAESVVFHKEGASIGSSSDGGKKSELADYYGLRNKLIFTKKFFPEALPTVYFGLMLSVLLRLKRRQWTRAIEILKLMIGAG